MRIAFLLSLYLLPLIQLLVSTSSSQPDSTVRGVLQPSKPIFLESVLLGGPGREYLLKDLYPGHSYEVRVSHPASIPVTLSLFLTNAAAADKPTSTLQTDNRFSEHHPELRRRFARKLLDCDKLIFTVGADGSVQEFAHPVVVVSAARRGIHRDGPEGGHKELIYNILLQPLVFGLPTDTLPVICACLVLLLAVFLILPWWVKRAAPQLLTFITQGVLPKAQ